MKSCRNRRARISGVGRCGVRTRSLAIEPLEDRTMLTSCEFPLPDPDISFRIASSGAIQTLDDHLSMNSRQFTIYEYADSGYNHFTPSPHHDPYDPYCVQLELQGNAPRGIYDTCMQATRPAGNNWGMLVFDYDKPYSFFPETSGIAPAGTTLQFEARVTTAGDNGDIIKFMVGGSASDSSSTEVYTALTTGWSSHAIDLAGKNLSRISTGFIAASGTVGDTNGDGVDELLDKGLDGCRFQIDNVRIVWPGIGRYEDQMPRSFITIPGSGDEFDRVNVNASFVYDSAVTISALLADGRFVQARRLGDTLLVLMQNDIIATQGNPNTYLPDGADHDGYRLHSSYMSGDAIDHVDGQPRPSGFYETTVDEWYVANHGIVCGDNAWAGLAMVDLYMHTDDLKYLNAAEGLAQWISSELHAAAGGFSIGWQTDANGQYVYQSDRSTEHNIDCYALFHALSTISADHGDLGKAQTYRQMARHAGDFVMSMFDNASGHFHVGTTGSGAATDTNSVVLDVQTWSVLAMTDGFYANAIDWTRPLAFVESNLRTTDSQGNPGVDFGYSATGGDNSPDGIWIEGVGQLVVAYRILGMDSLADEYQQSLDEWREADQLYYATQSGSLFTGLYLPNGLPWQVYHRRAMAPTAWAALAQLRANPFSVGPQL